MASLFLLLLGVSAGLGADTPARVDLVFVASPRQPPAALILRLRREPGERAQTQRYTFAATSWLDPSTSALTGDHLHRQQHRLVFEARPGLDAWPDREGYLFRWHSDGGLEIRLGPPRAVRLVTDPLPSQIAASTRRGSCLRHRVGAQMVQAGHRRRGWAQIEICSLGRTPQLLEPGQVWLATATHDLQTASLRADQSPSPSPIHLQWLAGIATPRRRWPQALRILTPEGPWTVQRSSWHPAREDSTLDPVAEAMLLSGHGLRGARWERATLLIVPLLRRGAADQKIHRTAHTQDAGDLSKQDGGSWPDGSTTGEQGPPSDLGQ